MVEIIGINAPIGILPGAAYGAVTGGVIGVFSSIVSGGDPVKGGLLGAVTGGILGGVIGGIEAQQLGINLWTGSGRSTVNFPLNEAEQSTTISQYENI